MNILKLDYQGLPVHANREAWFNATGIGETSRAPDDWKRRHYELNPIPSLKQH